MCYFESEKLLAGSRVMNEFEFPNHSLECFMDGRMHSKAEVKRAHGNYFLN